MLRKFIFYIFIFLSFNAIALDGNKNDCAKSEGVWRIYNNSCFDKCDKRIDKNTPCYKLLEYGCDCGVDKCWKDNECISTKNLKQKKYIIHIDSTKQLIAKKEIISKKEEKEEILESNNIINFITGLAPKTTTDTKSTNCINSGGKMRNFNNSCADNCQATSGAICAQTNIRSCDCGPNKCWNNTKCINENIRN
jgi:hypothetical protein